METTANFAAGLKIAYHAMEFEGRLDEQGRQVIGKIIEQPVIFSPDGVPILAMKRLHVAIRRLYAKMLGFVAVIGAIDWTKVIDWIKENWLTIVKIAITIIPFII